MECKSYFRLSPPKGQILESPLVARINTWKNKSIKMVDKSMKILRGLLALQTPSLLPFLTVIILKSFDHYTTLCTAF